MKPKLTLRDLFWLVLVCALVLGGWCMRRDRQKIVNAINEAGFFLVDDLPEYYLAPNK
jgi:hypothetical protein